MEGVLGRTCTLVLKDTTRIPCVYLPFTLSSSLHSYLEEREKKRNGKWRERDRKEREKTGERERKRSIRARSALLRINQFPSPG